LVIWGLAGAELCLIEVVTRRSLEATIVDYFEKYPDPGLSRAAAVDALLENLAAARK
jgi:hypothetical protein